jgi:hypothetical protein
MKKQPDLEDLTPTQRRDAIRMAEFFPSIAKGHGSTHRNIEDENRLSESAEFVIVGHRCSAKSCQGEEPNHSQKPLSRAIEFVVARDT